MPIGGRSADRSATGWRPVSVGLTASRRPPVQKQSLSCGQSSPKANWLDRCRHWLRSQDVEIGRGKLRQSWPGYQKALHMAHAEFC